MKFHRSTPDWVRREYDQLIQSDPSGEARSIDHLNVVLTQGLPPKVWRQLTPPVEYDPTQPQGTFVYQLALWLNGASCQFDGEFKMTRSERIHEAKRIQKLASELSSTLKGLRMGHSRNLLPMTFREERFALVADTIATEFILKAGIEFAQSTAESDECLASAHDISRCVSYAYDNLDRALDVVAEAAASWAIQPQGIAKPNDVNAARLNFLRWMTWGFVNFFGTPLREATLAVTQLFHDCSDIDEALLSRLAPVPKSARVQRQPVAKSGS